MLFLFVEKEAAVGRHGWILHTLARILDWLRLRARRISTAISARLAGLNRPDPTASIGGGETDRAASSLDSPTPSESRAEPQRTEHDPDLPKAFPGAERFESPVVSDPASPRANLLSTPSELDADELASDIPYASGKEGEEPDVDAAEDLTLDDTFTFTPDPSLDLVEDIEFVFEPEPHLGESASENAANGEDLVVAGDRPAPEAGAADFTAFAADGRTDTGLGWVEGNGSRECPDAFPIKGNGNSHIYHLPGQASYSATIPELCFASEDAASSEGYRPTRRSHASG